MVTTKRIAVGLRVAGKHGPLMANPSGGKRRVRDTAYGTVIRAVDKGQWEVRFDYDGRRKTVRNTTLKVVDDEVGIPIENLNLNKETVVTEVTAASTSGGSTMSQSITTAMSPELVRTFLIFVFVPNSKNKY